MKAQVRGLKLRWSFTIGRVKAQVRTLRTRRERARRSAKPQVRTSRLKLEAERSALFGALDAGPRAVLRGGVSGRCPATALHARPPGGCMPYVRGRGTRCGRPCGPGTRVRPGLWGPHTAHTGQCRWPRWVPIVHAPGRAPCRSRAADACLAHARAAMHARRSTAGRFRWCRGIPERGRACAVRGACPPPEVQHRRAVPVEWGRDGPPAAGDAHGAWDRGGASTHPIAPRQSITS